MEGISELLSQLLTLNPPLSPPGEGNSFENVGLLIHTFEEGDMVLVPSGGVAFAMGFCESRGVLLLG